MANRIVGKLGVKVIPDLSTFRADLKAKLKEVQDSVTAEIKASLNLDTAKFLTDVKAAAETAKLEVENVKATVKVNMDPQTAQFLARVKASLNSVDKAAVSIPITPETAKFRARLAELLNGVRATMSAKIPTDPAGLEEYKAKLRAQIFLVSKEVRASIKTDVDKSSLRSARSAFGGLAGALSSMENVFGGASKGALKFASDLGNAADEGGTVTSLFTHLGQVLSNLGQVASGAAIIALIAVLPSLIGAATIAVGALETALLALPGAIGAGGAALAVVAIAVQGVSKAVSLGFGAKNADDLKKYSDALGKLAPNARVAVEAIVGAKSAFSGFKTVIQDNFFAPFAGDLSALLQNQLPSLKVSLGDVALSLGHVVDGFVTWGSSQTGVTQINNLLRNSSQLFDALAPMVGPVVDSLARLANLSINTFLTPLAGDLTQAATKFDDFVKSTKGNKELTSAFSNLGTLFQGLAKPIGDLAANIFKVFGDPKTKDDIKNTFKLIQDAVDGLVKDGNLQKCADDLGKIAKNLDDIDKLAGGNAFSDALTVIEAGMIVLGGIAATTAEQIGLARKAIEIIVDIFKRFGDAVNNSSIADAIIAIFSTPVAIMEHFGVTLDNIKRIFQILIDLVKGPFTGTMNDVVGLMGGAPGRMLNPFSSFSARLGGIFHGSWANALGITNVGVGSLVNSISGGQGRAGNAASGIGNRIVGALSGLGGRMFGIGTQIVSGIVSGIESGFGWVMDTASRLAANAVAAAKAALGVHSPSRVFMNIGENVAQGFVIGMDNSHDSVATSAASLALSAVESAKTFANAMANNGIPPALIGAQFPQMAGLAGSAANDRPINVYLDNKKVGFGVTSGDRANQRRG